MEKINKNIKKQVKKCSAVAIDTNVLASLEAYRNSQEIKPSKINIINKLVRDFLKNKD